MTEPPSNAHELFLVQAHDGAGRPLFEADGTRVLIDRKQQVPARDAAASAVWWVFGLQGAGLLVLLVLAARTGR